MSSRVSDARLDLTGGLDAARDLPALDVDDVDERDGFWLIDDAGRFGIICWHLTTIPGLPKVRREFAGIVLPDERAVIVQGEGGRTTSDGPGGSATAFRCIKPFAHWRGELLGTGRLTTQSALARGPVGDGPRVVVRLNVDAHMVAPPWVLGTLTATPPSWTGGRHEQLCRAAVDLQIGDERTTFTASGVRTHNVRRVRTGVATPTGSEGGVTWQTALFPNGRAFAAMRFAGPDGSEGFGEGYVFDGNALRPASVIESPWYRAPLSVHDQVRIQLEVGGADTAITGSVISTIHKTVPFGRVDLGWFRSGVQDGGRVDGYAITRYEWDGEVAYGLLALELPPAATDVNRSSG